MKMKRIKFFVNSRESDGLADNMRKAGIVFSSISTSGPSVLWVDDRAHYGITAVKFAICYLIRERQNLLAVDVPRIIHTIVRET